MGNTAKPGPPPTLAQAARHPHGWNVRCGSCSRCSTLSQEEMAAIASRAPDAPLAALKGRLVCSACGHAGGEVWMASPDISGKQQG